MANNNKHKDGSYIKTSGATYTKIKKVNDKGESIKYGGLFHVFAWRKTSDGLITASCFPCQSKKTGLVVFTGSNGKEYCHYIVELKQGINITICYGIMERDSRKLYISKLGLVISKNGRGKTSTGKAVSGFFGRLKKL